MITVSGRPEEINKCLRCRALVPKMCYSRILPPRPGEECALESGSQPCVIHPPDGKTPFWWQRRRSGHRRRAKRGKRTQFITLLSNFPLTVFEEPFVTIRTYWIRAGREGDFYLRSRAAQRDGRSRIQARKDETDNKGKAAAHRPTLQPSSCAFARAVRTGRGEKNAIAAN